MRYSENNKAYAIDWSIIHADYVGGTFFLFVSRSFVPNRDLKFWIKKSYSRIKMFEHSFKL